jgi:Flp pilus assembly protein TadD
MEYNPAADLLGVAERVLSGWMAAGEGHVDDAVSALEEAVRREDALLYGEPPEWSVPARQDLGAVLLMAGQPAEAEQVFRADLAHFPQNGWSLHGLSLSLRRQGRSVEADSVGGEFLRVWAGSDVDPPDWQAR